MKRFIRDRATRAFLTPDGKWTEKMKDAWAFLDHNSLRETKRRMNLQNVELYCSFYDDHPTQWDFALPIE